jgi:hypothetical protein
LGRSNDLLASVCELVVLLGYANDDTSVPRHGALAEFVIIIFASGALFGAHVLRNRRRRIF